MQEVGSAIKVQGQKLVIQEEAVQTQTASQTAIQTLAIVQI